ncbi:MAG: hypothetical protein Q8R82_12100 [Hyphomonadaceae bacterium]|nr:hypothetical protein [Hyphomonadaceae bacterium]
MRFLPMAAVSGLMLASGPALAQTQAANADTYAAVIAHGVVIVLPDLEIDVKFAADGKFTAMGGASSGVWKIVGDKLCSTPNETLIETCGVYPAGKKSGDTFVISGPNGDVTVRIP